jgi:putative glycosyltransferase (TIGR04372 family)
MKNGRFIQPSAIEYVHISNSGFIPDKKNQKYRKILLVWHEAEEFQRLGEYGKAIIIRESLLNELYQMQGVDEENYYPPFLGEHWSSNFGHLTAIGNLSIASQLGIIPSGDRFLLSNLNNPNQELFQTVSKGFKVVPQQSGIGWSELPTFWHLAERLRMVKTTSGFMDSNKLFESVYSSLNAEASKGSYFSLANQLIEKSRVALFALGLPMNSRFVALHIRESNEISDPRKQTLSNYEMAIFELTSRGYWVIRIGTSENSKINSYPMVIDLVDSTDSHNWLHSYVLSQCEFYIGTASGPSWVPRLFGRPSLLTNLNEIATQVGTAPVYSIHLPKKYMHQDSRQLSAQELFERKFAFCSLNLKELRNLDIQLLENTPMEILQATIELIEYSERTCNYEKSKLSMALDTVRLEYSSPTWGRIGERYLESNPSWVD